MVWYELMTTDMEAAKAFYAEVVGWGTEDVSMPDSVYRWRGRGKRADGECEEIGLEAELARICRRQRGSRHRRPHQAAWRRRARPPNDIPNISRFSVAVDPQMATIALS